MKIQDIARLPADTFLADELTNDDGIIEMANLDKSQTGIVANSLPPRVLNQMSPLVIQWVTLNKGTLFDFWHHGDTWTASLLIQFLQSFGKV
jgi:hypothetical protein